jgi:hypothetical protein
MLAMSFNLIENHRLFGFILSSDASIFASIHLIDMAVKMFFEISYEHIHDFPRCVADYSKT